MPCSAAELSSYLCCFSDFRHPHGWKISAESHCRRSADSASVDGRKWLLTDCQPTANRRSTGGRLSTVNRPTVRRLSTECRPTVGFSGQKNTSSALTVFPFAFSLRSVFSRHVLLYWRHRDKKLFQNRVLDFSETFCSSIAPKWLGSRVASVSCRSSVGQASVDRQWRSTDNAPIVCRKLSIDYRPTASRARLERWRSVERQPPIRPPVGRHSTPFWTWYGTTDIRRLGIWWSSVGRPWPTVARRTADTRTMLEWQSVDARSKTHNVNTDAWSDN